MPRRILRKTKPSLFAGLFALFVGIGVLVADSHNLVRAEEPPSLFDQPAVCMPLVQSSSTTDSLTFGMTETERVGTAVADLFRALRLNDKALSLDQQNRAHIIRIAVVRSFALLMFTHTLDESEQKAAQALADALYARAAAAMP